MKYKKVLVLYLSMLLGASTFAPYANTASSNLKKDFLLNSGANIIGTSSGFLTLLCLHTALFTSDTFFEEGAQRARQRHPNVEPMSPVTGRVVFGFIGLFFGTISAASYWATWELFKNAATPQDG